MRRIAVFLAVLVVLAPSVSVAQSVWPASKVKFTDSEYLQAKFDAGELGGVTVDLFANLPIDGSNEAIYIVNDCVDTTCASGTGTPGSIWVQKVYNGAAWVNQASAGSATNLADVLAPTSITITNTNGTGFTLNGADATDAGLMIAADKASLDSIVAIAPVNINDATGGDLSALVQNAIETYCAFIPTSDTRYTCDIVIPSHPTPGSYYEITTPIEVSLAGSDGEGGNPPSAVWDVRIRGEGPTCVGQFSEDGAATATKCGVSIKWMGATADDMIKVHGAQSLELQNLYLVLDGEGDGDDLGPDAEIPARSGVALLSTNPASTSKGVRLKDVTIFGFSDSFATWAGTNANAFETTCLLVGDPDSTDNSQIDQVQIDGGVFACHNGIHITNGSTGTGGNSVWNALIYHAGVGVWNQTGDINIYNTLIASFPDNTTFASPTAEETAEMIACDRSQAAMRIGSVADELMAHNTNVYGGRWENECGRLVETVYLDTAAGRDNMRNAAVLFSGVNFEHGDKTMLCTDTTPADGLCDYDDARPICTDVFDNVVGSEQTTGSPDGLCDRDGISRLDDTAFYYTHAGTFTMTGSTIGSRGWQAGTDDFFTFSVPSDAGPFDNYELDISISAANLGDWNANTFQVGGPGGVPLDPTVHFARKMIGEDEVDAAGNWTWTGTQTHSGDLVVPVDATVAIQGAVTLDPTPNDENNDGFAPLIKYEAGGGVDMVAVGIFYGGANGLDAMESSGSNYLITYDATNDEFRPEAVADCDGANQALNFDATGNSYGCVTISGSGHTIEDAGVPLTDRSALNFTGAGVTCTDNPGADSTDCDIAGSPGGGDDITAAGEVFIDPVDPSFTDTASVDVQTTDAATDTIEWVVLPAGVTVGGTDVSGTLNALVVIDDQHAHTTTSISGLVDADITFTAPALAAATATTPAADDNDTSVATTAYVQGEINGAGGDDLTCTAGVCNVDNPVTAATTATTANGLAADAIDATTDFAAGLCTANQILERGATVWGCIATPTGGGDLWTSAAGVTSLDTPEDWAIGGTTNVAGVLFWDDSAGILYADGVTSRPSATPAMTLEDTDNNGQVAVMMSDEAGPNSIMGLQADVSGALKTIALVSGASAHFQIGGDDSSDGIGDGVLRILDENGVTDTWVDIQALDAGANNYTLTLPPDDGASGEVLSTNGAGVLDWITGGSGETNTIQGPEDAGNESLVHSTAKSGTALQVVSLAGADFNSAGDVITVADDGHAHTTTSISGLVDADITFTAPAIAAATATTPAVNDDDTSVATTAFVQDETVATGDVSGTLGTGFTIGAGVVEEGMLDVTNVPGAPEDGYALTWNQAGANMTWEDVSAALPALTSANVWVGNISNVATAVPLTGDVEVDNTGATTIDAITPASVTLTGTWANADVAQDLTISGGTISASTITLEDGAAPTALGQLKFDATAERLELGTGGTTLEFYDGQHIPDTTCETALCALNDDTTTIAAPNTNTSDLASTSFVQQEIDGAGGTGLSCGVGGGASLGTCNVDLGTDIDLTSAEVTGVLTADHGGTGNGFTAFSGPTTSTKTFTLPDATAVILTDNADVTVAQGGTGLSDGTSGGILGYTATGTLASSAVLSAGGIVVGGGAGATPTAVTAGTVSQLLVGGGAATAPVWTTATGTGAPVRAAGPVLTGTVDMGGANVEIENGAAPAPAAVGQIAIDTTDAGVGGDQFVYYDGSATRALTDVFQECVTIESLAAADDNKPIWMNSAWTDVTLISAACVCVGTCTTEADITLEIDETGSATINAVTGTITCEDSTAGDTNTTLSVNTNMDQYDVLRFDTAATPVISPETDDYVLCVNMRPVVQ